MGNWYAAKITPKVLWFFIREEKRLINLFFSFYSLYIEGNLVSWRVIVYRKPSEVEFELRNLLTQNTEQCEWNFALVFPETYFFPTFTMMHNIRAFGIQKPYSNIFFYKSIASNISFYNKTASILMTGIVFFTSLEHVLSMNILKSCYCFSAVLICIPLHSSYSGVHSFIFYSQITFYSICILDAFDRTIKEKKEIAEMWNIFKEFIIAKTKSLQR